MKKSAVFWLVTGWVGFAILPWYLDNVGGSLLSQSALALVLHGQSPWLAPLALPLLAAALPLVMTISARAFSQLLIWTGIALIAWMICQGAAIDHRGFTFEFLTAWFGAPGPRQFGMGYGALATALSGLMLLTHGLAARGFCRGDAFTVSSIGLVLASITLFVFFPVARILISAVQDNQGGFALLAFIDKLFDSSIWGLDCVSSSLRCGVGWNTLFLAVLVGVSSTALGLAFALIAARTGFRHKGVLRALTVLPIITPPFVIGLALILLFGRAGAITALLSDWFDIPRTRWIYGLPGVFLAQTLAFAPISFLVMMGVVQGVSPSLEEASQTLRARNWQTFRTITWPLMRPGIANSFLLGFVESMADFGNPVVLGGNFDVLSTKIFFAVVGAVHDQGRAAVLSLVLLAFTLGAFYAQHRWLGRASYTTVTGKGDSGLPATLPRRVSWLCFGLGMPWALLTIVIYITIFGASFINAIGIDYSLTVKHYVTAFAVTQTPRGWFFSGAAWNSFWATLEVSAIAAPITAGLGLLTAYLLARQSFAGRRTFEFGAMLSFAIPGTVIGVSYILAFNVPPLELTGTALILVICFVFRNMPVGIRSGMAALSQIDKSLDEASLTLGARTFTTVRRVMMPLLRPAIVASLIYSFVRAMTAVSAVIFLVSAEYNMATAYIVGRAEAGELGVAIAYSAVLILVMAVAISSIQLLVGERQLGRRGAAPVGAAIQVAG